MSEDLIDPPWYQRLQPQPVEVVEAWGLGWHLGSVVSYVARAGHKDADPLMDLQKARWFLDRYIKLLEAKRDPEPG
jgi:hypothetical protein